jgi:hypothetical protein
MTPHAGFPWVLIASQEQRHKYRKSIDRYRLRNTLHLFHNNRTENNKSRKCYQNMSVQWYHHRLRQGKP